MSFLDLLLIPFVLGVAAILWLMHANAWDLGGRSPVLSYDTAQYAVAARELAFRGRLATPFALPIELVHQAKPMWPLAVVQPGMVLLEAGVFKMFGNSGWQSSSDGRAYLTLMLPFTLFLLIAGSLSLGVWHLFRRWYPQATRFERNGAALTLGLMFALDPEAQHFATGGFTEIPFTAGLLFAFLGLALAHTHEMPLLFGFILGLTGLFRANMLWLAPLFAVAATALAPARDRLRVLVLVLIGFALPLLPWWFYKWREFGDPGWDLTRYVVWDGIENRSWFSLYHLPEVPSVPGGIHAISLLAAKVGRNLPTVLLAMTTGLRALWIGSIALWLIIVRPPRPLAVAALVVLAAAALGALSAAVSIPWLRYMFPTRVLLESAGMLAFWALIAGLPAASLSAFQRRALWVAAAVLALGWGGWQTSRGLAEARSTSSVRGVPSTSTFTELSILLNQDLESRVPIMSNLGPALAWQTTHPVLHLALTPDDVEACRRRLDFRVILLVFREAERAWPGWNEIMEQPGASKTMPRLHAIDERRYRTLDGFTVVRIELAPLEPGLALLP